MRRSVASNMLGLALGSSLGVICFIVAFHGSTTVIYHHNKEMFIARPDFNGKESPSNATIQDNDEDMLDQLYFQNDSESHQVENAIARLLYQKIRILCIVTIEEYNDRLFKFSHFLLKDRCNQIIYFSTALIYHQSIIYVGTSKFRDGKSALITEAFLQTARNHRNTADWYLRLSLRSFIIFENMRYFLSKFYPGEPLYFGAIANDNHGDPCLCSDYILSRKTFGLLVDALSISVVKRTSDQGSCQIRPNTEGKDVLDCFNNLMIKTESSFDALGRTRFHCFHPVIEVNRDFPEVFKRTNPDYRTRIGLSFPVNPRVDINFVTNQPLRSCTRWLLRGGLQKNASGVSDYAISFGRIDLVGQGGLEYFVYHLIPAGIRFELESLN